MIIGGEGFMWPATADVIEAEKRIDQSRQCDVGVVYDFLQNAEKCGEQLERSENDGSVAYFAFPWSIGSKHSGSSGYFVQSCRPGDTFTWENKNQKSAKLQSHECAAALTRRTGVEFEAVETNHGLIFSDFTVRPKSSGSAFGALFGDCATVLSKFQK